MRALTLDEKITLKGLLYARGVAPQNLVKLDMAQARFWWPRLYGRSISQYWRYT